MKLADLKFLLPRIKYSTHTPKAKPFSEGYFMQKRVLTGDAPKLFEKTPAVDKFTSSVNKSVSETSSIGKKHTD